MPISKFILALSILIVALTASALGERDASDWFNLGMVLYIQDNITGSLDAYNKALELNPLNEEAWNNKGIDLGILNRYSEALDAFNRATTINSSYAEAWYNMGVIFDLQGDYPSAVNAYNEAIKAKPNYQKALEGKASDEDILLAPSLSCNCPNQLPVI
ncbi:MAG: tetratricopeptide repeat protein [Methanotrichaceae archaeon]